MDDLDLALLEFINEYPASATLFREATGDYNPATGTTETVTDEIPVQAILMDLTLQSNGLSVKYNTMIEAGDKELYMRPPHKTQGSPTPFEINPVSDRILIGGIMYKIVTYKELNPTAADPVLVTLYLRR